MAEVSVEVVMWIVEYSIELPSTSSFPSRRLFL